MSDFAARALFMVVLFVCIAGVLLGAMALVDALTEGGNREPVLRDGRVCIASLDVWGSIEDLKCPKGE